MKQKRTKSLLSDVVSTAMRPAKQGSDQTMVTKVNNEDESVSILVISMPQNLGCVPVWSVLPSGRASDLSVSSSFRSSYCRKMMGAFLLDMMITRAKTVMNI